MQHVGYHLRFVCFWNWVISQWFRKWAQPFLLPKKKKCLSFPPCFSNKQPNSRWVHPKKANRKKQLSRINSVFVVTGHYYVHWDEKVYASPWQYSDGGNRHVSGSTMVRRYWEWQLSGGIRLTLQEIRGEKKRCISTCCLCLQLCGFNLMRNWDLSPSRPQKSNQRAAMPHYFNKRWWENGGTFFSFFSDVPALRRTKKIRRTSVGLL